MAARPPQRQRRPRRSRSGQAEKARPRVGWLLPAAIVLAAGLGLWALSGSGGKTGREWAGAVGAGASTSSAGASASSQPAAAGAQSQDQAPNEVEDLVVRVLAAYPHDPSAYTQGLVWDGGGGFFESDGRYGFSTLRWVDLATGEVRRRLELPPEIFAEGLALVPPTAGGGPGRLTQLTWREGQAMVWGAAAFERLGTFHYQGEGWGLCWDGRRLVMSDGGAALTFRDPGDFAATGVVQVTLRGQPVRGLNELECAGGAVWANVYTTSAIVRIDPESGRVTGVVDASGLLTPEEAAAAEVLNGIAYDPAGDVFYITGKNWPKLFAVRFVARPSSRKLGG